MFFKVFYHLEKWERSRGHHWNGEEVERNVRVGTMVEFVCGVCGKRCKSKGGLTVHRRRMHEVSSRKKSFACEACGSSFQQEANKLNHMKICGGAVASQTDRRVCACGREFSKSYIARHRKKCMRAIAAGEEAAERRPRVYKGKRCVCSCGVEMASTNLARHKREACPDR